MDLTRKIARLRYVYGWRLRYWWLDTRNGLITRYALAVMALIAVMGDAVYLVVKAQQPVPAGQPKEAIIWWIVYLIVVLVVAALAIATMPHPKGQQPTQADTPTVEDGQTVLDIFGTCWVDDSFILAWRIVGKDPIKASGGK